MKLGEISTRKLLDWAQEAWENAPGGDTQAEIHIVGQGYELRAEGSDALFIEPERRTQIMGAIRDPEDH